MIKLEICNIVISYHNGPSHSTKPSSPHFKFVIGILFSHKQRGWIDIHKNKLCILQKVVDLVSNNALNGKFPMNLPLEMRFMADSDAYMAPCSSSNPLYGGSGQAGTLVDLTV